MLEKIKALQEIYESAKFNYLMKKYKKTLLDWLEEYAEYKPALSTVWNSIGRGRGVAVADADSNSSFLSARHFREFTEKEHGFPGIAQNAEAAI